MHSKTLYLLLAFAVTIAAVTAYWDDDDDEDDELFDFEEMMEKRGRKKGNKNRKGKGKGKNKKPKWEDCPENDRCQCILRKDGTIKLRGACIPTVPGGVGL